MIGSGSGLRLVTTSQVMIESNAFSISVPLSISNTFFISLLVTIPNFTFFVSKYLISSKASVYILESTAKVSFATLLNVSKNRL